MHKYIVLWLLVSSYLRFKNECEKVTLTKSDSVKYCESILKKNVVL